MVNRNPVRLSAKFEKRLEELITNVKKSFGIELSKPKASIIIAENLPNPIILTEKNLLKILGNKE